MMNKQSIVLCYLTLLNKIVEYTATLLNNSIDTIISMLSKANTLDIG
jgi:hypothetical protein